MSRQCLGAEKDVEIVEILGFTFLVFFSNKNVAGDVEEIDSFGVGVLEIFVEIYMRACCLFAFFFIFGFDVIIFMMYLFFVFH